MSKYYTKIRLKRSTLTAHGKHAIKALKPQASQPTVDTGRAFRPGHHPQRCFQIEIGEEETLSWLISKCCRFLSKKVLKRLMTIIKEKKTKGEEPLWHGHAKAWQALPPGLWAGPEPSGRPKQPSPAGARFKGWSKHNLHVRSSLQLRFREVSKNINFNGRETEGLKN